LTVHFEDSGAQSLTCRRCGGEIAPGGLACASCHALVHADALTELAARANAQEARGEWRQARDTWLTALELLPPRVAQADWIHAHVATLEEAAQTQTAEPAHSWARKLGPLAPIALLLAKGKSLLVLLKLNFLISLGAFMGFYWAVYGAQFGIGFAVLILWHEMGHFIEVRRRGLPADMPVFLPGFGAFVRWRALGVSLETRAMVSLAGPFAGWVAAVACAALWSSTGNSLWAALARAGAWLNALNLVPVWVLDGGQAASAMNKTERLALLSAALVLWFVVGESVFFLVALGAAWRAFMSDTPAQPSRATTLRYIALLAGLAGVMWITASQSPFGERSRQDRSHVLRKSAVATTSAITITQPSAHPTRSSR
jgi:Zn-dependent protease